jgi:hypothetical protein
LPMIANRIANVTREAVSQRLDEIHPERPTLPSPPCRRGVQHSVGLGSITYPNTNFLTATIRLFGDSGAQDKGMPFYTVSNAVMKYGLDGFRPLVTPNISAASMGCKSDHR